MAAIVPPKELRHHVFGRSLALNRGHEGELRLFLQTSMCPDSVDVPSSGVAPDTGDVL